jgi:GTP cyclohydrolase IA
VRGASSPPELTEANAAKVERMASLVHALLAEVGEDMSREGLQKTPQRMAKALLYLTSGMDVDPVAVLRSALFDIETGGGMVVVKDIEFSSLCEHHVLPFMGRVHIGYLPRAKVVGLSKLARAATAIARRLQVQERLTHQIAAAVQEATDARGVAVFCEAEHTCMTVRGAEKVGAITSTSCFLGELRDNELLRREFFEHIRHRSSSSS